MISSPLIRAAIALLYAVPATIAGYHATLGLAHIGVPSEAWREVFAVIGAVLVGGTAWARMSLYNPMFAEEPLPKVQLRRGRWRAPPRKGKPALPRRPVGCRCDDGPSG
ncbi:MAG: hypothetical protein WDN69_24630 [Aliidongia sp.]